MARRFGEVWTGQRDPVVLCNGPACVALFRNLDGHALSGDADSYNRHFALTVDRANFAQAQVHFQALGSAYKFWDHKICHSLYLEDPDDHQIEVVTYDL